MKYIGVDNGLSGGIAVIEGTKVHELITMPTVQATDTRGEYDVHAIVKLLKRYPDARVIIEKAHAMPKLGTVSAFSFGKLYGMMQGITAALEMPMSIVHSKTWQKEMFRDLNSSNTKQASVIIAKQLYPEQSFLPTERSKKPHDGLTDAILIATYGQRHSL